MGGGAATAATAAQTGATVGGAADNKKPKPTKPTWNAAAKRGQDPETKRFVKAPKPVGGLKGLLGRVGLGMTGLAAGAVSTLGIMAGVGAAAGIGAAAYGLYKLIENEKEGKKGRVQQAIEDETISQQSRDFARQAALTDMKDDPRLKSFAEWEKSEGMKPITGDSKNAQQLRAKRQQKYEEENMEAQAELEQEVINILSNFIENKREKQDRMVSDIAQGKGLFGAMMKKGIVSPAEGVRQGQVAQYLTAWMNGNPGKPITKEVMEDAGLVFSEGGFEEKFTVPNVRPDHAFSKSKGGSSLSAIGVKPGEMTMMGLGVKSGTFGQNYNERYKKLNELQKVREEQLRKEAEDGRQSNAGNTGGTQTGAINVQSQSGTAVPPPVLVGGLTQSDASERGLGLVTNIG